MGSRDYRKRESKKPKKDTKKISATEILQPLVSVEVVKKEKKEREQIQKEREEGILERQKKSALKKYRWCLLI